MTRPDCDAITSKDLILFLQSVFHSLFKTQSLIWTLDFEARDLEERAISHHESSLRVKLNLGFVAGIVGQNEGGV